MSNLRVPSTLSIEDEDLVSRTTGAAMAVYRQLGPGFWESIYQRALCLQRRADGIGFDIEVPVPLWFLGEQIGVHRHDLLVEHR